MAFWECRERTQSVRSVYICGKGVVLEGCRVVAAFFRKLWEVVWELSVDLARGMEKIMKKYRTTVKNYAKSMKINEIS